MKIKNYLAVTAAVATFFGLFHQAQAQNWQAELNAAKVEDLSGAELGIGYNFRAGRFRLTPTVGGLIYQGDNNRYYMDDMSNGSRCRDRTNGQFSDTANCDNTAIKAYAKLEVGVKFAETWDIGAGLRAGDETIPYGIVSVDFGPSGSLKAFGGDDYYGLGVHLRF